MAELSDYRNTTVRRGNVCIRALDVADSAELVAISRATFFDTFEPASGAENVNCYMDQAYAPSTLAKELADQDSLFFFAYDVSPQTDRLTEPIAYLKLAVGASQSEHLLTNAGEVMRIYVLPHGKRRGVGSALLAYAEDIFCALGKSQVWLGVWEHNYAAQEFYKRHGYRRFSEHSFPVGDDPQIDWLLSKKL